jgi:hypothetical protein
VALATRTPVSTLKADARLLTSVLPVLIAPKPNSRTTLSPTSCWDAVPINRRYRPSAKANTRDQLQILLTESARCIRHIRSLHANVNSCIQGRVPRITTFQHIRCSSHEVYFPSLLLDQDVSRNFLVCFEQILELQLVRASTTESLVVGARPAGLC